MDPGTKAAEAIHLFIQTDRLHRSVFDNLTQSIGLHRNQSLILFYLKQHGEIGQQKEIAAFLGISAAAVTVSLKKLEAIGYLKRAISESDNRNHIIQLTEAGNQAVLKIRRMFRDTDLRMLEGLTEQELDIFMECHRTIQENLRSLGGTVAPMIPEGEKL